jgi:hypothetical protein
MLFILIVAGGMAMILWKFDNVHKMSNRRIEKENKKKQKNN